MANQTNRPASRQEFMNSLVEPYSKKNGNPNNITSQPKSIGQPEHNRSSEYSISDSKDRVFNIGIKDIDEAVVYYFKNVLKLSVIQNNEKVDVPIIYGTPENWKSFQTDGYYRDKEGRLMAPLLMFRRTTVTQNRSLGNKLDANKPNNIQIFEKKYSKRNAYSNFTLLHSKNNKRSEEKEYIVSITPDYVTLEYSCVIWTHYVEQMDKLIESLNYASRSYWGDPKRFQFYSSIETFIDNTIYNQSEERAVRTNFTLTLNGYLIPDTVNAKIFANNKVFGASKLVFSLETTNNNLDIYTKEDMSSLSKISAVDGINNANFITNNYTGYDPLVVEYLTKIKNSIGNVTSPIIMEFGIVATPPPTTPVPINPPSIADYIITINGQKIDPSEMASYTVSPGQPLRVTINPTILGYSLLSTDLVAAVGKFQ